MSSAFVDNRTYTRVIGDAEDAHAYLAEVERFEVELRPLDAGDRAKIRDALAIQSGEEGVGLALGTVELLHVRQAVVSWTLPAAATPATIGRLKPEALEAIRGFVAWGTIPPAPPTKSELDAADDEPSSSTEAREATERRRADLEDDELRDEEAPGVVPLPSSRRVADAAS